jgi:predicted Ser/Thr protein kinase
MLNPNTLLQNRYLVLEQIGHGGMGAVYRATDQRFGSTVALKETFFDDPSLRRAFEREAHLLNRLRHSALPRVSDHFTEEQGQFLVMEFIEGPDLSELMETRGAAFPVEQVAAWADQLLDALDYLHTQEPSVIHRDIKPQNLKLTARNQIILLDFGLAKGTPAAHTRSSATASVFGYSRNYAPLEQMQGTGTDHRSDLYSLAATLYHLATSAVPPDALTRAMAMVNGQPDPLAPAHEVHAQVTPSVAAVLARAMRQSAAQRYQTAEEMRAELREAVRRVAEERAATVLDGAAAASAPASQNQETQLMGGQTSAHGPAGVTRAGGDAGRISAAHESGARARTAALAGGLEAATLLNPANTSLAGAPSTPAAGGAGESVVTRVAPAHGATQRRSFPRALAAFASVLVLLAVAGAFYAYTRRDDARTAASDQPAPQPAATATPQPQPAVQQVQVGSPQPSPAPVAEAAPAPQAKQPAKVVKRVEGGTGQGAGAAEPGKQTIVVQVPEAPEMPEPLEPDEARGLSPEEREELRRLPRRIRRMVLEQKRLNMQRQRQFERDRRGRRPRQEPPPYPPE